MMEGMDVKNISLLPPEVIRRISDHVEAIPTQNFLIISQLYDVVKLDYYVSPDELLNIVMKLYPKLEETFLRLGNFVFWKKANYSKYGEVKPRPIDILLAIDNNVAYRSWSAIKYFNLTTQLPTKPLVTTRLHKDVYEKFYDGWLYENWRNYMLNGINFEFRKPLSEHNLGLVNLTYVNCYEPETFKLISRPQYEESNKKNTPHQAMVDLTKQLVLSNKSFSLQVVENIINFEGKDNQILFKEVVRCL